MLVLSDGVNCGSAGKDDGVLDVDGRGSGSDRIWFHSWVGPLS